MDDHHGRGDPRRFKVHYEGMSPYAVERLSRGSYNDLDRDNAPDSILAYDDRNGSDRYRDKRRRTRSRSPARYSRNIDHPGRGYQSGRSNTRNAGLDKYGYEGSTKKSFVAQSVSDRGNPQFDAHVSKREAESGFTPSQHDSVTIAKGKKTMVYVVPLLPLADMPLIVPDRSSKSGPDGRDGELEHGNKVDMPPPPIIDETLSIEERRKRREAIKAKYKGQATPLLVQALQLGSAPGSPLSTEQTPVARSDRSGKPESLYLVAYTNSNDSVSPAGSSPRTPQHESSMGSPPAVTVSTDAELANNNPPTASTEDTDEPSAADYDPTMDMQEDRMRDDQRHLPQDTPAEDYDEMMVDERQKQVTKSLLNSLDIPLPSEKRKAEDMFASDNDGDEDDMFAPNVAKMPSMSNGQSTKPPPIPRAKELDMSLLDNWDDHEGYYRVILGELLDGRYHVQANLGKGMFSSVVRATDNKTDQLVAIKVIRQNESMIKAGTKEMQILQKLASADPEDKKHLIRLERSFTHKGHLCMVFENLSINLREVLKKFGRDVGINLKAVRSYAQQMFFALSLLRKCNILHADLKPDNILVNEARNVLKVCDLGSAADATEGGNNEITPYLVSRFYRAPEIILGVPYDYAIDTWSVGCTLFELYTGKILFTGRTNNQMLRSIMECRGKFSLKMLKKAEFGAVHFDETNLNFRSMEKDKITGRDVTKLINFVKPPRDLKSRLLASNNSQGKKGLLPEAEMRELNLFADLLDRCLALNPERRITPAEALKHPFIYRAIPIGKI